MDPAPVPLPPAPAPEPPAPLPPAPAVEPPALLLVWPRSAQLATAFLCGAAAALMAAHVCSLLRWGSRPMELERESSLAYRIDLNHAPPAELVQLPGIGATLAERIADYRGRRGGFRSVDELVEVGGIGPATLERLRPWVWVDAARSGDDPQTPSGAARPSRPSGLDTPAVPAREFGAKKIAALTGPIDINRATVEELQRLPGIGPKLSQRIVDERGKGLFKAPEDLKRVSGIGPKTLERVRPYVIVGSDLPKGGTAD